MIAVMSKVVNTHSHKYYPIRPKILYNITTMAPVIKHTH
jgi:hypothetical protein